MQFFQGVGEEEETTTWPTWHLSPCFWTILVPSPTKINCPQKFEKKQAFIFMVSESDRQGII